MFTFYEIKTIPIFITCENIIFIVLYQLNCHLHSLVMYACSTASNDPITWKKFSASRHVDREEKTPECGRKVI